MKPKCSACEASGFNVQRIVLQVVAGTCYQAHGQFCDECRESLPEKLQDIGFTLIDGRGQEIPKKRKPAPPKPTPPPVTPPVEEKPVPITSGPSKGGQNPPRPPSLRPPAPTGSGTKDSDKK